MNSCDYFKNIMADQNDYDKLRVFDSVKELFVTTCSAYPNNNAVIWNSGLVTYQKLLDDALKLSFALKSKFNKGDNVGLFFGNEYDFVRSFFACSILGLVCAVIPGSMPVEKLGGLTMMFDLKGIVTNRETNVEKIENININNIDLSNSWTIDEAMKEAEICPNDPACIVFTGGTTGFPKGALLSQKNLCRGAFNGALVKGKVFNIKYLSLIPFSHIFGLIKNLLSCILTGSELYIVCNPALFAKEAAMYQPETLVLTPGLRSIVLTLMRNYGKQMFGNNFKTIIAGGAHVPQKLIET